MNKSAKPLLSYLLLTYNQERYVREAVESAFAQNYSPLEIIISDDHSTDNTWEIIKELFNKYNGPHKVIINRNKQNLGIANHVNKVMSMAKGELFIMAAGDDIALPEKSKIFYEAWANDPQNIMALCSNYIIISEKGIIKEEIKVKNIGLDNRNLLCIFKENNWHGCSVAYNKLLFKYFGNIQRNAEEDKTYFRRACLLGKVFRINKTLIYYRENGISNSTSHDLKKSIKAKQLTIESLKCFFYDTKKIAIPFSVKLSVLKRLICHLLLLKICFICLYLSINPYIVKSNIHRLWTKNKI